MRIALTQKGPIGCISLSSGKDDTRTISDDAELSRILEAKDLKAAVVIIDLRTEEPPLEVAHLKRALETATIPTAAVINDDADTQTGELASACLFRFDASREAPDAMLLQAESHLTTMVINRYPHVIRAVMTSLNNADALCLEDALLEETRLFCGLSRKNRESNREAFDS